MIFFPISNIIKKFKLLLLAFVCTTFYHWHDRFKLFLFFISFFSIPFYSTLLFSYFFNYISLAWIMKFSKISLQRWRNYYARRRVNIRRTTSGRFRRKRILIFMIPMDGWNGPSLGRIPPVHRRRQAQEYKASSSCQLQVSRENISPPLASKKCCSIEIGLPNTWDAPVGQWGGSKTFFL